MVTDGFAIYFKFQRCKIFCCKNKKKNNEKKQTRKNNNEKKIKNKEKKYCNRYESKATYKSVPKMQHVRDKDNTIIIGWKD